VAGETSHVDLRALPGQIRIFPRGGHEPARVSGTVQERSDGLCRGRRASAGGHRRAGAHRYPRRSAAEPHLPEQGHQALSGLRRLLRHGGGHRAPGLLPEARRAGAGGEEADPLPARPGRRRQVVAGGEAQGADAAHPLLRHQGLAGVRVAAEPVLAGGGRADPGRGLRHPDRYLRTIMSPWAVKRLQEYNGDITKFRVVKLYPSILEQVAIAKTEPGDENNQDISSLVGKVDIRQLEHLRPERRRRLQLLRRPVPRQPGPDGVRRDVQGADQGAASAADGHPGGQLQRHRGLSAIPFQGIILAHSNESEWQSFRNNKNNEAFLDRVFIVKVPYCLRVTEEKHIYDKLLRNSSLARRPARRARWR
jgi:hypothetical protein